jgi:hypothetical protein
MRRSAIVRRLLLVVLPPALLGCGAEGDDSRPPITTVQAPVQVETQDVDDVEADDGEDEKGESRGKGKEKDKGKGKGRALGHAKKEDE